MASLRRAPRPRATADRPRDRRRGAQATGHRHERPLHPAASASVLPAHARRRAGRLPGRGAPFRALPQPPDLSGADAGAGGSRRRRAARRPREQPTMRVTVRRAIDALVAGVALALLAPVLAALAILVRATSPGP